MIKYISLLAAVVLLVSSCEINQKDVQPTDNFIKIYNHPDENLAYYVESVLKLSDGYMILSGIKDYNNPENFLRSSLIKTNNQGEIAWTADNDFLGPAGNLVDFQGKIGYVAQDNNNNALFIEINLENGATTSHSLVENDWPLASEVDSDGKLIVVSYNTGSFNTSISTFNSLTSQNSSHSIGVGSDMRIPIHSHLNKNITPFPFYVGEWNDSVSKGFFVNCLANSTLGVLFFDNDGNLLRSNNTFFGWLVVGGITNGISSLIHKQDNTYAFTRYLDNRNFIHPAEEIIIREPNSFNDNSENTLNEIVPKAKVSAIRASFGANEYMLFGSTSNSNSIIIYQYKMDEDELLYQHQVEFADNVEVTQIIQDPDDKGIVVLAQLHVTGRFLRPVLIKIPAKDFSQE